MKKTLDFSFCLLLCLPECVTGFTFVDVIFPSKGRREKPRPQHPHTSWSPGIDDVPRDKGLTSVWVSDGEGWLLKDSSEAGLSCHEEQDGEAQT